MVTASEARLYAILLAAGLAADVLLLVRCRAPLAGLMGACRDRLASRALPEIRVLRLVFWLLVVQLGLGVATGLTQRWLGGTCMPAPWQIQAVGTGCFLAAAFCLVAVQVHDGSGSWQRSFGFCPGSVLTAAGRGVLLYAAAMPAVLAATLAAHAAMAALDREPDMQAALEMILMQSDPVALTATLVLAVAVAPFVEELVFRGVILPVVVRRWGVWAGVVGTSVLFAGLHAHAASFVTLLAIGAAFALAYLFTGNLLVPTVMHALFNAVNIGIAFGIR